MLAAIAALVIVMLVVGIFFGSTKAMQGGSFLVGLGGAEFFVEWQYAWLGFFANHRLSCYGCSNNIAVLDIQVSGKSLNPVFGQN